MVKVGDEIKTDSGTGKVTHILRREDGRYVILYKQEGEPHYCIEGDDKWKVIKKGNPNR